MAHCMTYFSVLFVLVQSTFAFDDVCNAEGERCVVPFQVNGKTYTDCTTVGNYFPVPGTRWCPMELLPGGRARLSICTNCTGDAICYMKGNSYPLPFSVDCPASCQNVYKQLWGSKKIYSLDSFVCAAAFHSAVLPLGRPGSIQVTSAAAPAVYPGSVQKGIASKPKAEAIGAFTISKLKRNDAIPMFVFSNTIQIGRYAPNAGVKYIVNGLKDMFALDIDLKRRIIYIGDLKLRQIISVSYVTNNIVPTSFTRLQHDTTVLSPRGLAIDWVHQNLYWTDSGHHTVMVLATTSTEPKTLIKRDEGYAPRAIELDPEKGLMFISDAGGAPKIEKCSMVGGDTCTTIVLTNLKLVTGLAIDYLPTRRLYWTDALGHKISSCLYDGSGMVDLVNGKNVANLPIGLTLSGNRLYWTNRDAMGISSIDKTNGANLRILMGGLKSTGGIKAVDPKRQPTKTELRHYGYYGITVTGKGPNRCAGSPCQFLCLADVNKGYKCACPNGYQPTSDDSSTCVKLAPTVPPPGSVVDLVAADFSKIQTFKYNWNTISGRGKPLINNVNNAIALTYDPANSALYWTTGTTKTISRAYLGPNQNLIRSETLLHGSANSSYLRLADGIAVDWISANLYWTDIQLHSVFLTKLSVARDETFVTTIFARNATYKPRAIAVHPGEGWIFVSDWGSEPKIERCWMDGSSCTTIVIVNIRWPNGLVLDFDDERLIWVDAKLDSITSCNFDGTDSRVLVQSQKSAPHPFGVAVYHDRVYYTDWGLKNIMSCNKTTGSNIRGVVSGLQRPSGISVLDNLYTNLAFENRCSGNTCSHLCVIVPAFGGSTRSKCMCPDLFRSKVSELRECREDIADGTGSKVTSCDEGFQPSAQLERCEDINDCLRGNGGCQQVCVNIPGSFHCDCNEGYELNADGKTCTKIFNVCTNNPCTHSGVCVLASNELGYVCECTQGFRGTNCAKAYGEIAVSITGKIVSGSSFVLTCVVPLQVTAKIIWFRNRDELISGKDQVVINNNGRELNLYHVTYEEAGEYKCQFSFDGNERNAWRIIEIESRTRTVCGKALGINNAYRQKEARIFGGQKVVKFGAPFMVFLYRTTPGDEGVFCGGSLIEPYRIVTAAHCVRLVNGSDFKVYAGKLDSDIRNIEPYQQSATVSHILLHPDYEEESYHADIAIITLHTKIIFTKGVKPLCVPHSSNNATELKPRPAKRGSIKYGMVFGYGITEIRTQKRVLREVKLPIRKNSYCNKRFTEPLTKLMFCAGGDSIQDACKGDSGGPFTLWSSASQSWWLAGIVSWGEGCANPEKPGVYTRVGTTVRQWIYDNSDM